MTDQIVQRSRLAGAGEPGVLHVALDQAVSLQRVSDAGGNVLDEFLPFVRARAGDMPERVACSGRLRMKSL
jgi:hypothetical protein